MPTDVLNIVVDDQGGARVVTRNLQNLGRAGDRAEKATQFLKRALLGIGAAATIRQLARMSDEVTRMGNTLRTNFGPGGAGKANAALAELSEIAARSRGSLSAVVETYDTLVDATERLGVSTDRLLPITETALKLFRIGGQDAEQAAGSVRALGAAMASNDFSRAITTLLRQNLDFANSIAKAYGTNAEELRKFAKDGRLTAESFIVALERVRGETDATFGLTASTIGDATTQLRDALTLLVGKFFETTDTGTVLTEAFASLAKHIRDLANDTARMDAIAKPFVATLRALAEAAQRTAFTFGGNPDLFGLGGVSNADIQERLSQLREMQRVLSTPADQLGLFDRARKALIPTDDATFSPDRIKADIARLEAEQRRRFLANAKPPPGFQPKPEPATDTGTGTPDPRSLLAPGNAATAELEKQAKATRDAVDAFNQLRSAQDPLVAAGQQYAQSIQTINAAAATGRIGQDALAAAYEGAKDELLKAHSEANTVATEDFRQLQAQLDPLVALEQRHAEAIKVIAAAAATGRISTEELAAANEKLDASYAKAKQELGEGGPTIFDAIAGSANGALDAVVQFTSQGTGSIKEFATSTIAALQKVILKLLVVKALEAAGNSAGGGIGGLLTGLAGSLGGARAEGGPVTPGKAFLVGERGPELFTPPQRGSIVPNDKLGGGAGSNVTVVNVLDHSEVARMVGSAEGEKAILNVINRNRGRVRQSVGG